MNDDKLPNYYDVRIQAEKCHPKPGHVAKYPYTLFVESVEAPDPETAVKQVLRKHWLEDCDWFPSEGETCCGIGRLAAPPQATKQRRLLFTTVRLTRSLMLWRVFTGRCWIL